MFIKIYSPSIDKNSSFLESMISKYKNFYYNFDITTTEPLKLNICYAIVHTV